VDEKKSIGVTEKAFSIYIENGGSYKEIDDFQSSKTVLCLVYKHWWEVVSK
jgi:hypothetical protein